MPINRPPSLLFLTLYTLFLIYCLPLFTSFTPLYFAPLLVFSVSKSDLKAALLLAFFSGLLIDLLSSHTGIGLYAVNYCLITALLYRFKSLFFDEGWTTLPLLTFFFSVFSTLLLILSYQIRGEAFSATPSSLFYHLALMPLADALYALLAFSLPFFLFTQIRYRYLLYKRKNRRN